MPVRNKKILQSAKGEDCQVRLNGVCNFNPETTIPAHIGHGGGWATKASDIHIAYCCSSCHDEIDRRTRILDGDFVQLAAFEGMQRTQNILVEKGLINA